MLKIMLSSGSALPKKSTRSHHLLGYASLGSLSASVDEALCKNRDKCKDLTPYIVQQTHDPLYNSCFLRKGYLNNKHNATIESNYPFLGNSGIDYEALAVPGLSSESKIPYVWRCICYVNIAPNSFRDSRAFNKLRVWHPRDLYVSVYIQEHWTCSSCGSSSSSSGGVYRKPKNCCWPKSY